MQRISTDNNTDDNNQMMMVSMRLKLIVYIVKNVVLAKYGGHI